MDALKTEGESTRESITQYEESMERLRSEYSLVNKEVTSVLGTCPACQQALPEHQIKIATDIANVAKAEKLEEINKQGKGFAEKVEGWQKRLDDLAKESDNLSEAVLTNVSRIESLASDLEVPQDNNAEVLGAEVDALTKLIETPQAGEAGTKVLQGQLETLEENIAKIRSSDESKTRIEELKAKEKELSAEYEGLESGICLIETFIVSKVDLLESKINNTFEKARFKLFDKQINGGIKETCQTLYEGVPYDTGLNSGAKMMVGLDIIKVLQKSFKITAPIFIDNRESIVSLPEMDSQIISLIVDEKYETLDIKVLN
jgi:chromosome segregation ATPase